MLIENPCRALNPTPLSSDSSWTSPKGSPQTRRVCLEGTKDFLSVLFYRRPFWPCKVLEVEGFWGPVVIVGGIHRVLGAYGNGRKNTARHL